MENSVVDKKAKRKQYWFVIRELTSREIKRKYARSFLGIIWSILNPILTMAVLSLVFSKMFSKSIENFPIYYLTGNIIWGLFSSGTNLAMDALVSNRNMLLKVKIPKQVFVLARLYTALVNFGYSFIAYVLMLIVFRIKPSITMLLLPIDIFFVALFAMGFGYALSVIYVFFADIKHLYGVVLTLWTYLCAIFYPVSALPDALQEILQWNPLFIAIDFARDCMMYQTVPSIASWIKLICFGVSSFVIGFLIFKKNENMVMQEI